MLVPVEGNTKCLPPIRNGTAPDPWTFLSLGSEPEALLSPAFVRLQSRSQLLESELNKSSVLATFYSFGDNTVQYSNASVSQIGPALAPLFPFESQPACDRGKRQH